MSPFHDCAFHVGVLAHVESNAFDLQLVLKRSVQKFFSSIRVHPDWPPAYRLRVLRVFKNRFKVEVTEGPIFDFRVTTCRYFESRL